MSEKSTELCDDYFQEVESAFGYLTKDHGFRVGYSERSRTSEACMMILENRIRLKFVFDRGGVEILLGSLDAPSAWGDKESGRRRWFQLLGAVMMVRGDPKPTTETVMALGRRAIALGRAGYLRYAATELEPVLARLELLFSGDKAQEAEQNLHEYFYR